MTDDGSRRRTAKLLVPAIVAIGALVGTGIAGCAADDAQAFPTSSSPAALTAPQASSTVVAAVAKTVALPRSARAEATIDRWALAKSTVLGEVKPEVGSAKDGAVALGIDAPVVKKATTAASAPVTLQPGVAYRLQASVRVASKTAKTIPLTFRVGGATLPVTTKFDAKWATISLPFTAAADSGTRLDVQVSKAVRGLSIDGLSIFEVGAPASANLVPNGSFESVNAKGIIANTSLVMTTPTAAVAVVAPKGKKVTWSVKRGSKKIANGSVTSAGEMVGIPLTKVKQGYYSLSVTVSGKSAVSTKIAVLDSPNAWLIQDSRYGVGLHAEAPLYAESGKYTRALGIGAARNDVLWNLVERKKNKYTFDVYDAPFERLAAQGVGIVGIVTYGNPAYGSANKYTPTNTTGLNAYAKYASIVAKRYSNLVGLEVYNEFNHKSHNKASCRTGTCYAKLLKAVDKSVSKARPGLPVIAGGTANYDAKFFNSLWRVKGALKISDAASFHPYQVNGSPEKLPGLVSQARASMKKYAKSTKPIWITELGTSSKKGGRTQTQQASILVRASTTAFSSGVKKFFWYDLINDGPSSKEHYHNFGLYSHPQKNVAALAPKESGFAQALTITQLGGRGFSTNENLGKGVVSRAFGASNDRVRVVWSSKGSKTAKIKTTKPVVLVNFDGTSKTLKPKKGVVSFKVTTNPVFIRSGKATAGVTR